MSSGQLPLPDKSVHKFYQGKCVLITGASGFVGKVILEKLLREFSDIQTCYLLLRSKQGIDPRRRVEELTNSIVFSRLRRENESMLQRIVAVSGDITFPGLGLSPVDQRILSENVSIVFHVAATIRFDEPLRRAVDINVAGTKRVLELCKKLTKFKALVHVSTAYCNKVKANIKEKVYEDVTDPDKIIEIASWMDEEILNSMSEHLYDGRPSSYHYTKALAENLLLKEQSKMSIAIVRPSIITAAIREPIPGWIDNYNGPTGYFVVSGKGILRSLVVEKEKICDMVPVDIVANTCILTAAHIALTAVNTVKVYNCTSGSTNAISWGRVKEISDPLLIKNPSMELFRYPGCYFHSSKMLHQLHLLIEHSAIAHFVDFVFKVTGHKPMLRQVYAKVNRTIVALEYFTTNEWTFDNKNQLSLCTDFSVTDADTFLTDTRSIHWPNYLETYILGVRKFLLKEDPSTLPSARIKLQRLYYIMLLAKITAVLGTIHQLWYHYPTLRFIWRQFALPLLKRTQLVR